MLNVATPLAFTLFVDSTVAPSVKVTTLAGVPTPGADAVTVAVNVTDCPKVDGFGDESSVVVVLAFAITSVSVAVP